MTLQQLEYIVAVDNHRHFARAADACGVTQSTLSSLIQKLEAELDVTVFDRKAHPVRPTATGAEIIARARQLLVNAAKLRELVAARKGESVGDLSLGITSTIAPYLIPGMFRYMTAAHPDIRMRVEEGRLPAIISQLERGELDVAVTATPVGHKDLLEIPVYTEQLMAYVSPGEPMYTLPELPAATLPVQSVWMLREGYCPGRGIFPFCECRGDRRTVYEAGSVETLIRIVDENGGYAIIPELQLPLLDDRQRKNVRRLYEPRPAREIALVVHRYFVRERLLNILADAIKAVIPDEMICDRLKKYPIVL